MNTEKISKLNELKAAIEDLDKIHHIKILKILSVSSKWKDKGASIIGEPNNRNLKKFWLVL